LAFLRTSTEKEYKRITCLHVWYRALKAIAGQSQNPHRF
jgi:hypothetical protein